MILHNIALPTYTRAVCSLSLLIMDNDSDPQLPKLTEPPSFVPPLPAYGERFDLYLERLFKALLHHLLSERTYLAEVS